MKSDRPEIHEISSFSIIMQANVKAFELYLINNFIMANGRKIAQFYTPMPSSLLNVVWTVSF